jgi:hypothetical protein
MSVTDEEVVEVVEVTPAGLVCPECGAEPPSTIGHEPLKKAWVGSHRKRVHGIEPERKPAGKKKPGPKAGVSRERRRGPGEGPGPNPPPPPAAAPFDFQAKLAQVEEVKKWILTNGNGVILGISPMVLGIPVQAILTEAIVRPDGTQVQIGQVILFSEGEAMVLALAAVFGGEAPWLMELLMKMLPPAVMIAGGGVLVAHGYNAYKIGNEYRNAVGRTATPSSNSNGAGSHFATAEPLGI